MPFKEIKQTKNKKPEKPVQTPTSANNVKKNSTSVSKYGLIK